MIKNVLLRLSRSQSLYALNYVNSLAPSCTAVKSTLTQPSTRSYSYFRSNVEESPDKYTKYEKSFEEWKFVEKLIPPTHVPAAPTDLSVELPSGWKPQNLSKDSQYLVRRTKNHQLPVYLKIEFRGQVRHTYIRRVEGNIWQLEKDIGEFLQDKIPQKVIITRTHELHRQVIIKGDLVEHVKNWLIERGH